MIPDTSRHAHRSVSARLDALGNVAGATISAIINAFGLVLAKRDDAPTWVISAGVIAMFLPSVLAWVVPLLSRRIRLGTLVLLFRLLAGVALLPCALYPSLATFLIGCMLELTAIGLADYSYPVLMKQLYPADAHRRIFGMIYTLRALLMFTSFVALGWVLDHLTHDAAAGYRLLALVGIALSLISAAASWPSRRLRDSGGDSADDAAGASPWQNPMFRRYLLILTVFGVGNAAFQVLWPLMVAGDWLALSYSELGILQALSMLAQMAAYSWFSRFGQLRPTLRMTAPIFLVYTFPCLAALLLHHLAASHAVIFWTLVPVLLLYNAFSGIWTMYFYLLVNAMAGNASPLPYQTTQGTVVGIRGVLVPPLTALFCDHFSLTPSLLLTTGFFLAAAVIAAVSPRRFAALAADPAPAKEATPS